MKDKSIAYLLWAGAFLGVAGLQRIYLGKNATGFLYLFTWGLCGIGKFIDMFMIPDMVDVVNNRLYVQQVAGLAPGGAPALLPGRHVPRNTEEFQVALVQAAGTRKGKLSVAEAVAATGRGFKDVERELNKMVVDGYIEAESDEAGNLYYKFPGLGRAEGRETA